MKTTTAALDGLSRRLAVGAGDRDLIPIVSPATGEIVGEVPHSSEEDVAAAVQRARAAQRAVSPR